MRAMLLTLFALCLFVGVLAQNALSQFQTLSAPLVPTTTTTTTKTVFVLNSNLVMIMNENDYPGLYSLDGVYPVSTRNEAPSVTFCTIKCGGYCANDPNRSWVPIVETSFGAAYARFFDYLNANGGIRIDGERHQPTLIEVASPPNMSDIARYVWILRTIPCDFWLGPALEEASQVMANMAPDPSYPMVMVTAFDYRESTFMSKGGQVIGLMPPPKQVMKDSLRLAQSTGQILTVAYHWEGTSSLSYQICHSVEDWVQSTNTQVVLRSGWNDAADIANISKVMAQLTPDLIVFCVRDYTKCKWVVDSMMAHGVNAYSVIASGCLLWDSYIQSLGFAGRFILGSEVWNTKLLAPPSNLRATGMTAGDFTSFYQASFPNKNPNVYHALAWQAMDLLTWALEKVGNLHRKDLIAAVMRSATGMNSIGIPLNFNPDGQNIAEGVTIQWQQQPLNANGSNTTQAASPDVWRVWEKPETVSPAIYASQYPWFPKPTWDHLQCYRSDAQGGEYGFDHPNNPNAQCHRCATGQRSVTLTAVLAPKASFGRIAFRECLNCSAGKMLMQIVANTTFNSYTCSACHTGTYASHFGATSCESCTVGHYQPLMGQTECFPCPKGRYQDRSGTSTCFACSSPKVAVVNGSRTCTSCPNGAICHPDETGLYSSYTNKEGWYLLSPGEFDAKKWASGDVGAAYPLGKPFQCVFMEDVCRPFRRCVSDGVDGASFGPMCGVCAASHEKSSALGTCNKCPSVFVSMLFVLLNAILTSTLAMICLVEVVSSDHKGVQYIYCLIIRQAINYSTLAYAVKDFVTFKVGGTSIWEYLYWTQHIGMTRPMIIETSMTCLMRELRPNTEPSYAFLTVGFLMVPMWIVIDILLFVLGMCFTKSCQKRLQKHSENLPIRPLTTTCDKLLAFIFIHVHINLGRITRIFVAPFKCLTFDVNRYLFNTNIKCDDRDHVRWQMVAACGIVGVSCAIPFVMYVILSSHKKSETVLDDPRVLRKYGFFFVGFHKRTWYFETINMFRNVVFLVVPSLPIFAADNVRTRNYASVAILLTVSVIFFFIHFHFKPYDHRHCYLLSRLENAMLISIFITLAAQAFNLTTDNSAVFINHQTGEVHDSRRDLRDTILFIIVTFSHVVVSAMVLWALIRPMVFRLRYFKQLIHRRHGVSIIKGGIDTDSLSRSAIDLLADFCAHLAGEYLENAPVFNFSNYGLLLKRVITDAAYWSRLEARYGHFACELHHHLRSVALHPDTLYAPEVAEKIASAVQSSIDQIFGEEAEPEAAKQIYSRVLEDLTDLNKYIGDSVEAEQIYLSHTRCYRDIKLACQNFDGNDSPSDSIACINHAVAQVLANETAGKEDRDTIQRFYSCDSEVTHDFNRMHPFRRHLKDSNSKDETQLSIHPEALREACDALVNAIAASGTARSNGVPLDPERMMAARSRRLRRSLRSVQHDSALIAAEISEFLRRRQGAVGSQVTRTASDLAAELIGVPIRISIIGASDLRRKESVLPQARFHVQTVVTCFIVGRPLVDFRSRFSTFPSRELENPDWQIRYQDGQPLSDGNPIFCTGTLLGFIEHEKDALQFEIWDVYDQTLLGTVVLECDEFHEKASKGVFEENLCLKGTHSKKHHTGQRPRLLVQIQIPQKEQAEPQHGNDANSTDTDTSVSEPMVQPEMPKKDDSNDLALHADIDVEIDRCFPHIDAEIDIDAMPQEDAWNESEAASEVKAALEAQILELRKQIAEAEKEYEDTLQERRPLQILSFEVNFKGNIDPLLEVGRPILGTAQNARAAQSASTRTVEVQTEITLADNQQDTELNLLNAELMKLDHDKQNLDMQIEKCTAEVERLHHELDEIEKSNRTHK